MCTNAKSLTQITEYLTTLKPVFVPHMYSSQKYMCSFARTLWLTIFTYDQTFGWILSYDRPLYCLCIAFASESDRAQKQATRKD